MIRLRRLLHYLSFYKWLLVLDRYYCMVLTSIWSIVSCVHIQLSVFQSPLENGDLLRSGTDVYQYW